MCEEAWSLIPNNRGSRWGSLRICPHTQGTYSTFCQTTHFSVDIKRSLVRGQVLFLGILET